MINSTLISGTYKISVILTVIPWKRTAGIIPIHQMGKLKPSSSG